MIPVASLGASLWRYRKIIGVGLVVLTFAIGAWQIKRLSAKVKDQRSEISRLERAIIANRKSYELSISQARKASRVNKVALDKALGEIRTMREALKKYEKAAREAKSIGEAPAVPLFFDSPSR